MAQVWSHLKQRLSIHHWYELEHKQIFNFCKARCKRCIIIESLLSHSRHEKQECIIIV